MQLEAKKTNELYTTITRLIRALFEMAPELDFIDQSERRTIVWPNTTVHINDRKLVLLDKYVTVPTNQSSFF